MKRNQPGSSAIRVINSNGHSVGLDIGATAVRAAVLTPAMVDGQPSVTTHALGVTPLPIGAVVNGVVIDQGAVTKAIKHLWSENKFDSHNVIVGITHQQSVVRDLDMPVLSPELLRKALPYQAREIVPFAMDQALLDFLPLGPADKNTDMVRGLLVAVPRGPVLAAVTAVERAGLKVARVDLSTFALLRSMAHAEDAIEAVVDIGQHVTNIIIHRDGIPKVVRTVSRGGSELTERIADRTGLELAEAETAKCLNGITGRQREVVDAISDGVRPLMAEIRSSVHYFSSTNSNLSPTRITLTGGGSNLPGLAELLADQLGISAEVVEPMQHIRNRWSPAAKKDSPESAATAVSIGLAMGAAA